MNRSCTLTLLAAALFACSGVAVATVPQVSTAKPAAPASDNPPGESNADLLKAMDAADTWGHPDLFGEFAGMKRYAKGDYKSAMTYFLIGARYADKPSQLAIGIMYVNGLGVAKDLATGCAWLDLAAERKYPRFVNTYDVNCKALTPMQQQQMGDELAKLRPEFGDKAAKQRMSTQLRLARSQQTGSRTGYDFGTEVHSPAGIGFGAASIANSAPRNCGNEVVYAGGAALPTKGCTGSGFWSADRWDPDSYFRQRDAQWLGTVTVGKMEHVEQPSAAAANGQPAAASSAGH